MVSTNELLTIVRELYNEFDFSNSEGIEIGSFQVANLYFETFDILVQKIIDRSKSILAYNDNLYDVELMTFSQFKNSNVSDPYTEKIYTKNLRGYIEWIHSFNPRLANFFLHRYQPYLTDISRDCHTAIFGITGGGKTETLKIFANHHIKKNDCACLILDPHGDFAYETYTSKAFQDNPQRLVVVDYKLQKDQTPIFNVFDQIPLVDKDGNIDEDRIDRISQHLSGAFVAICTDDQTSTYTYKMSTILRTCVRVLLRRPESTLWDLLRFMQDSGNEDLINLGKTDPNILTSEFFKINNFNGKTYTETKNAIYNRMFMVLQDNVVQKMTTGASTIKLESLLNDKKNNFIVVVNLSIGKLGPYASNALGKLFLATTNAIGMNRQEIKVKWQRHKTFVFVDEVQNFVYDGLGVTLTQLRKYGMFLNMACQYVNQIPDKALVENILNNTRMKIATQTSDTSAEKLSKEMRIDKETLATLKRQEIIINYRKSNNVPVTIKIKATDEYADAKYAMKKEKRDVVEGYQISKYYKHIDFYKDWIRTQASNAVAYREKMENQKRTGNSKPVQRKNKPDKPNPNDIRFD